MQRISYTVLLILITLASCSSGGQYNEMRQRLDALNALNRADSVLTVKERDEAQALADYFDSHGTPNDQLLAHFLLGRCYADMREAPMALHCYQEAITRADTTAKDCDFAQLSRVYGQSSAIFYQQGLYRNAMEYDDMSAKYGWLGKDTLNALRSYAMKAASYDQLQMKDSAILIYEDAIRQMKAFKYNKVAAGFSGTLAKKLIDKGETAQALPYLQYYEQNSGYFDSEGNIAKGREVYYYAKGLYHLKNHMYDSAEYYFRKELHTGKDFNNQNYGSHGLAMLFKQKHFLDSASYYSEYSYAMNDSFYLQRATHEVEHAKAMYDYSRHQRQALIDRDRANSERQRFLIACIIAAMILSVLVYIYYKYRKQKMLRRQEEEKYSQGRTKYRQILAEVEQLHHRETELTEIIKNHEFTINSQKLALADISGLKTELENLRKIKKHLSVTVKKQEEEAADLQSQLAKYKLRIDASAAESEKEISEKLYGYSIYKTLVDKDKYPDLLSDEDWEKIDAMIREVFPEFSLFLAAKKPLFDDVVDYRVCCLARLNLQPMACSYCLGISGSNYSKRRSKLIEKLFGVTGNGKDFDRLIRKV